MSAVLQSALVNGQLIHASKWAGVAPRHRPAATCSGCGESVVWKVGDVVVPHVAHAPGSLCPMTNPEGVAHFNAKMRLAEILATARPIVLAFRCRANHATASKWFVNPWTSAVPEHRLGTRRPDVVLLAVAGHVGALEVLLSHAVDKEKAADLAALGVPWIEVTAADALRWDGVAPLPIQQADATTIAAFAAHCGECERQREFQRVDGEKMRGIEAEWAKVRAEKAAADALAGPPEPERPPQMRPWLEAERRRVETLPAIFAAPPALRMAIGLARNGAGLWRAGVTAMNDGGGLTVLDLSEHGAVSEECASYLALCEAANSVYASEKKTATFFLADCRAAGRVNMPVAEVDGEGGARLTRKTQAQLKAALVVGWMKGLVCGADPNSLEGEWVRYAADEAAGARRIVP